MYATRLGLLAAALLCAACGKSTTMNPDMGIEFDADIPDAPSPDLGADEGTDVPPPVESDIGEACSGETCDSFCIEDFPGGYCTAPCGGGGDECPEGSDCTPVGRGQMICLSTCDPSAERPCPRAGYGCTSDVRFGTVCIPGCTSDSDCPMGLECDPDGGFAGEGTCFDPDSGLGDACEEDEMCPSGGFCLAEDFSGWPGGACIGFDCDLDADTGCDSDARCIPGGMGGALCIDGCGVDDDCRDGFRCDTTDEYPDRLICLPGCTTDAQCSDGRVCNPAVGSCDVPFDADELGAQCSARRDACDGGTCLTEFASGYPGSYCVYLGCDATMPDADDGCPGDGVCVAGDDDDGFCFDGCEDDRDCRAPDYECRDVDPDDATRGRGCFPSCVSDDACANDGTMGRPDFSCNPGTGLCTLPFDSDRLGEPCEDADDCPGGACISEPAEGWPAGTCAGVGCRLSGTGDAFECPDGGVCVDDEAGDPAIGACLTACDTETSGCRPGYACEALVEGETGGACVPACEVDSCSGGRVCDTETGLCAAS